SNPPFCCPSSKMVKLDIHTLAHHLKQERLYVNSEKQLIQRLNAEVLKTAEKLYRTAWISKQQRINLDRLIITSAEASPAECCQHAKVLEDTQFVDGYKQLGFQETAYGEFLNRLRENPRLIASCLVAGEKLNQENTQSVIHTVFTSIYGNCIMPEDESYLLQVLRYLIEFELKESDNPRRLLRRGTCAFSILFKLFSEGLFSAKLFLTATLHEPIMQLLVEDEDHLETDPNKLIDRFSPSQQEKLFGEKGTEKFRQKVQEMVESNEAKLVALVNKFIGYLKQNTYCFPHSLRWIVSQMYKTLSCVDRLDVGEVRAMCTDLLLACFICPAVVNPEQYGIISDAPINEVARFNLMQVGRLLQQLAMTSSEEGDPRTKSHLGKFDKVSFMRNVMSGDQLKEDRMALESLLLNLPQSKPGKSSSLEMTPYNTPQLSPATTPANKKNRLPIGQQLAAITAWDTSATNLTSHINLVTPFATRSRSRSNIQAEQHADHDGFSQETIQEVQPEEVLVISLGTGPQITPGMMSENEVLNMQLADGGQGDVPVDETKLHGKPDKTLRFSLCSDNLEGISEGPSNRSNSVSSLDLEGESVSELGAGPSGSNGVEALQLLEHEQATTQDNLDDKLRKFEIRDMMGLTEDRDISETVSETWSTDVLGSDFDPNIDEDRLQEIAGAAAENMLGSLLCLPGSGSVLFDPCTGSTISETTSEAWSVEVLPSDSEAPDLKQEERLQELESCSGVGSTSDDTDVREVSSRPSTPGLSVVSGTSQLTSPPSQAESLLAMFDPLSSHEAVVRPKVHYARPSHPPPDPPILEGTLGGNDARLPNFGSHTAILIDSEAFKQRYSYPERLVRSRSSDIVSSARRPMSDPGWNRRAGNEERELAAPGGSIGGAALITAQIPFRKKEKQDKDKDDFVPDRYGSLQDDPGPRLSAQAQAAEDILDKYRNAIKRTSPNEGAVVSYDSTDTIGDGESIHDSPRDDALQNMSADDLPDSASQAAQPQDSAFSYSETLVADSVAFPMLSHSTRNGLPDHTDPEDNEIVCFLKVQLAEAINLQDKNLMAQLQETMRCVGRFDNRTCRKLLASIAEDYRKRAPYIAYLTRCRQGLQTTQAHLERLLQRVLRDKVVANRYFTTVCVRLLLESKESKIREFIQDFQKLTAADDKTAQVEDFLQFLYGAMAQDVIWQNASEEQLQDAQLAIERSVMNRIFKLAFYPNQDGDILRDQLLHDHIQRLSKVVTANHKALQIPEVYLREAPWPSAQSEIRTISAYKTPRDKLQCVLRMCSTIMNLLSLANEDSVPGADDFVPVLVFVLIKANPPCLLSTVQYISSFYASCLTGEESYWWMQFTAAVEFIKTIDERK
ncbi:hypothetical protein JD844_004790, partial [Phrynosoma platyrhinos]